MVMRFLGGGVGHVDPSQYVPAERESTTEAGARGVDGNSMGGGDEMELQFEDDDNEGPGSGTEGLEGGTDNLEGDAEAIGCAEEREEDEDDQAAEEDSGYPDGEEVREGHGTDNEGEGDLNPSDCEDDSGSLGDFGYD